MTMSRKQKDARLKTGKGRKLSSTLWLKRQINDPYVLEAQRRGYRSRSAFKLMQLDNKLKLLKPGMRVVDLGAAPGGWSQVLAKKVAGGQIVATDIKEIESIPGVDFLQMDFTAPDAPDKIKALLKGPADLVLSDMAASATGHKQTDHLRIMALAEMAYDFARDILAPGGGFICKVLQGGTEKDLLEALKKNFKTVKHIKPKASRSDSSEIYVVALGFR